MQALEHAPRAPSSRRRLISGITALVAFGLFLILNFWPAWSSLPFLTSSMTYSIGAVDLALWSVIAFNVAFLFADAPALRLTAHLVIAMFTMFALTRLLRDFPFALSSGVWAGVVHWILILGVVVAFLAIPVTWWHMVTQGYEGPGAPRRHRRHRHA
ncbi:MAG: hypothetical protein L0H79_08390 [Intrasporangium sp.]|uniref:hypothetical protein n=1 Tax=Intrasporangium sp. TaxID=1925024 RepID=UPI0026495079|nr:hypothetical protein [Intrasporangium sp.]MDN5795756.1 hypothetical protein [Intrasporangium sp.]